ncbi:5-formyltetrahydrofolate cyclo-ligase [Deinococcus peraridilitoris]|uniref:5-formyltetrahydrofolate cyclo-ligase n=1 Tax=Deinococcus peraridilitoris (strain DSM 19664 / LMG 22246 / CIP 109416 / KR-200) TaxID=937777 RepID=L0A0E4_DEIPD|nr:5-formyltetrahydrofolate cyclo-ligase [Deinococcus peraridilitoris]AFZ67363.1 5,10-methenyltetrahydrofolate synthetase [Deinococcus peraridilitoris DSM 19664]
MQAAPTKASLRVWAKARRAGLPDVSPLLTAHLAAWLRSRNIRRVLAYRAFGGEPSVDALASGFELFTTRARWRPAPHLTLHPWASATQRGKLGILEPPPHAPQVPHQDIEAVLVPGLAFDVYGVRLGYGGGFYDRLLPALRVPLIGVTGSALLLPELPGETHDVRMHFIATEQGVQPARDKSSAGMP